MPRFLPRPMIISDNQQLGFKILPNYGLARTNGIYFELNMDGSETILWEKELLVCPQKAMLYDPYVITFDTFGSASKHHAIVVYGPGGQVTADLAVSDFLSDLEIQQVFVEDEMTDGLDVSFSDFSWWQNARISVVQNPAHELCIHLIWGKVLVVNLETGTVSQYWPPAVSGKYGLYSEKHINTDIR